MENSNNSTTIQIRRSSQFEGAALAFKVFINGIEVGRIKRKGQEMSFPIQSGRNLVQVKTLFRKTNPLVLEVSLKESITLDCGTDSTGFYLRDSKGVNPTIDNQYTVETYDAWMKSKWYIVLICIIIGSFVVGALFPDGIRIGGLRLTAGIGVAAGFLLSYLVYKIKSPQ